MSPALTIKVNPLTETVSFAFGSLRLAPVLREPFRDFLDVIEDDF